MRLTAKQRLFANEYIKSGNAMQSAIKAGYSDKYAKARSAQMLENVGIKAYIDAKMAEIESSKIADAKEVLEFYTRVLREEETEEVTLAAGDKVVTVRKKPSTKDKIAVSREIMKRYPLLDPMANEQLRKLKADVRIAEAKAKAIEDSGQDIVTALDSIMDKLVGESDKESNHKH